MQFPRLVYKAADVHTLAHDADEHAALIADGWFASVPEALAPKPVAEVASSVVVDPVAEVAEDAPPTRAELNDKARELGLKFDGRTSDRNLARMIEVALGVA